MARTVNRHSNAQCRCCQLCLFGLHGIWVLGRDHWGVFLSFHCRYFLVVFIRIVLRWKQCIKCLFSLQRNMVCTSLSHMIEFIASISFTQWRGTSHLSTSSTSKPWQVLLFYVLSSMYSTWRLEIVKLEGGLIGFCKFNFSSQFLVFADNKSEPDATMRK